MGPFDQIQSAALGAFTSEARSKAALQAINYDHAKWSAANDLAQQQNVREDERHKQNTQLNAVELDTRKVAYRKAELEQSAKESNSFYSHVLGDFDAETVRDVDFNSVDDKTLYRTFDRFAGYNNVEGSAGSKVMSSIVNQLTGGKRDSGNFVLRNGQYYLETRSSDGSKPNGVITKGGKTVEEDPNDPAMPLSREEIAGVMNLANRAMAAGVPGHLWGAFISRDGDGSISSTPAGEAIATNPTVAADVKQVMQTGGTEAVKKYLDDMNMQGSVQPEEEQTPPNSTPQRDVLGPKAFAQKLGSLPLEEMQQNIAQNPQDTYVPKSGAYNAGAAVREAFTQREATQSEKAIVARINAPGRAFKTAVGDFFKGLTSDGQTSDDGKSDVKKDTPKAPAISDIDSVLAKTPNPKSPEAFQQAVEQHRTSGSVSANTAVKSIAPSVKAGRGINQKQAANLAFWGAVSGTLEMKDAITLKETGYLNTSHLALAYGDDSKQAELAYTYASAQATVTRAQATATGKPEDIAKKYAERNKSVSDIVKAAGIDKDLATRYSDKLNMGVNSYLSFIGINDPGDQRIELERNQAFYAGAATQAAKSYDPQKHGDFNAYFVATMVGQERRLIGADTPDDITQTYYTTLQALNAGSDNVDSQQRKASILADVMRIEQQATGRSEIPSSDMMELTLQVEQLMSEVKRDERTADKWADRPTSELKDVAVKIIMSNRHGDKITGR